MNAEVQKVENNGDRLVEELRGNDFAARRVIETLEIPDGYELQIG